MPLSAGTMFAGYTIERLLGAGGMGEVYLAKHPRLPRSDALKILPASLPGSSATSDEDYRRRFVREADLSAKLWHPNIVAVHDRGEYQGQLWISMDFVQGTDGAELLAVYPKGVRPTLCLQMVTEVAAALDHAHSQGLLHRDVKPGNILLTESTPHRVMLTDFGIARPIAETSDLTMAGFAVGTVAYAAPEQLRGLPVDARADIYALGATAVALLTGAPPGSGRELAPAVAPVINRALATDPADRYPTCGDFARDLAVALNLPPVTPPPTTPPADSHDAQHAPTLLGLPTIAPRTSPDPPPEAFPPTQIAPTPPPTQRYAPTGPPMGPPHQYLTSQPITPRSRTPWIAGGIAGVVVVALAVVAAIVLWPSDDAKETNSDPNRNPTVANAEIPGTQTQTVTVTQQLSTTQPTPATQLANPADLGLSVPISTPACDGTAVIVVHNATEPSSYRSEIAGALAANPGAQYLRTDYSCPSLRQRADNGNLIYAAYVVVGQGRNALCSALPGFPDGAYGKLFDTTSDPATYVTPADC